MEKELIFVCFKSFVLIKSLKFWKSLVSEVVGVCKWDFYAKIKLGFH